MISLAQVAGLSDLRSGRVAAAVDAALAALDGRPGGLDAALREELATLSDCLVLDGQGVSLDVHGVELAAVRVLLAALAALAVDTTGAGGPCPAEGSRPAGS